MKLKRSFAFTALVLCFLLAVAQTGFTAVSAKEAEQLKSTLTPMGAERAGNKEGTIPAWDGGFKNIPPGFKEPEVMADPFASEKALFSITSKNMDQYADKLSEGNKVLLKKYPSYRMDVYPTHRTAAAPEWVYQNTFKNATRAKTEHNGESLKGAYGGVPFPIPKDGSEAMWNHLVRWMGEAFDTVWRGYTITGAGNRILITVTKRWAQFPYYYKDGSLASFNGDYADYLMFTKEPPFKNGEAILAKYPVDYFGTEGQLTWQYLVGQRRVRRAPSGFSYDTPNTVLSGVANWDEVGLFFGALDRYNWKLLGKKELYIPYNENKFARGKVNNVLSSHFFNPDYVRWELHRVWVVEATLRSGKRHAVPKRLFYLDEDTWGGVLGEGWDAQGKLWKSYFSLPVIHPEVPLVSTLVWGVFNLQTGEWVISNLMNESSIPFKNVVPRRPDSFYSPETLVGLGVR